MLRPSIHQPFSFFRASSSRFTTTAGNIKRVEEECGTPLKRRSYTTPASSSVQEVLLSVRPALDFSNLLERTRRENGMGKKYKKIKHELRSGQQGSNEVVTRHRWELFTTSLSSHSHRPKGRLGARSAPALLRNDLSTNVDSR